MTVKVDVEKLTHGLEDGIGRNESSDIFMLDTFSRFPVQQRLRLTPCGLVATAIDVYARREGFESRLLISSPNLKHDPEAQHVMAAIEDDTNNPTVIDASISRLLEDTGLSVAYEQAAHQELFPKEKIIVFDLYSPHTAVNWLVSAVEKFRENRHPLPLDPHYTYIGPDGVPYYVGGSLFDASSEELRQIYGAFYNPDNLQTWTPPKHVIDGAEAVAEAIPPGAIEID